MAGRGTKISAGERLATLGVGSLASLMKRRRRDCGSRRVISFNSSLKTTNTRRPSVLRAPPPSLPPRPPVPSTPSIVARQHGCRPDGGYASVFALPVKPTLLPLHKRVGNTERRKKLARSPRAVNFPQRLWVFSECLVGQRKSETQNVKHQKQLLGLRRVRRPLLVTVVFLFPKAVQTEGLWFK